MATRLSAAARNAAVNSVVALIDQGPGGRMQIRTGSQPPTPDDPATGTLLVSINLNDPSFAAAVLGTAVLDVTPTLVGVATASGTAGWFRMLSSSGSAIIDGSITMMGGGGEIQMNTTVIVATQPVTIVAGSVTMPAST